MALWDVYRDGTSLVLGGIEAETREEALNNVIGRLEAVFIGADCRHCKHLVDVRPPRTRKWIGGCEYSLGPQDCGRFEVD